MLVRWSSFRKNSLRSSPERRGTLRLLGDPGEFLPRRAGEEGQGSLLGERRIRQKGVPDARPEPPPVVAGHDDQNLGSARRRQGHHVRLDRETVVQERRQDAGVRVVSESRQGTPPR